MRGAGLSAHVRSSNVTVCREMSVTGETMADDGILEPWGSGLARINRATGERLAVVGAAMQLRDLPCPACGSGSFRPLVVRNDFPIVRCDSCGSLYARPRPVEEQLASLYERFPQLSNGREGQANDDPQDGRWEAEYRLRRLLEFVKAGRLLDVGCGRGDFLTVAQRHFEVQGVDLVPRLRPEARTHHVFRGRLEDAGYPNAYFDVVTAVEVFEHMFDPRRTIREIHRVLKSRGILLFQTGDADSLRARLNLRTWTYLQPPVHLNVFSRKALEQLAAAAGFLPLTSWSFGRAPRKIPLLANLWHADALRPVLDILASRRVIGAMHVWRSEI